MKKKSKKAKKHSRKKHNRKMVNKPVHKKKRRHITKSKKRKPKKHFHALKGSGKMKKSKKRRGKHSRRSPSHQDQIIIMGKHGKKKRHGRGRKFHGLGDPGSFVSDLGLNTVNVLSGVAGGVIGSFAANKIPIGNSKAKAIGLAILGILVATVAKVPAVRLAGLGMGIAGGFSGLRQFVPGVPLLAGEMIPVQEQRQIPDQSSIMGEMVPVSGYGGGIRTGYQTQLDN